MHQIGDQMPSIENSAKKNLFSASSALTDGFPAMGYSKMYALIHIAIELILTDGKNNNKMGKKPIK